MACRNNKQKEQQQFCDAFRYLSKAKGAVFLKQAKTLRGKLDEKRELMRREPNDLRLKTIYNTRWVPKFVEEVKKRTCLAPEDRADLLADLSHVGPKSFSFELPGHLVDCSVEELLDKDLNSNECNIVCAYALHKLQTEQETKKDWLKVLDAMSNKLVTSLQEEDGAAKNDGENKKKRKTEGQSSASSGACAAAPPDESAEKKQTSWFDAAAQCLVGLCST